MEKGGKRSAYLSYIVCTEQKGDFATFVRHRKIVPVVFVSD